MENRRAFLRTSAAGLLILKPDTVFGTQANSALDVGIIGCGGRGLYIGNFFVQHAGARIVALHDPFADRREAAQKRFDVPAGRLYKGLEGYQELVASKLDAVAIESPPYYHPEQAEAAVRAGKHVYLAKPVCVDVPGARSIMATAEKASGKVSLLVDFQTRVQPAFMEAAKRIHEGGIGTPVLGHVFYHAGRLRPKTVEGNTADQNRLRNWVFDKALSGDIIVEQNVHVLDTANWYLKARPLKAYGTGGRRARTDVGDCWDHFLVTFWYPNEVKVDFSSAQFTKGFDDLCIRLYGTAGTADTHYGGSVRITGDAAWKGADKDNTFADGAIANVKAFAESIRSGKYLNNGAEAAESSLTTILGRLAAYENRLVTWDEMMKSKARLRAEVKV